MSCQLSVVVPVYNLEGTLSRCVSSILSQTFQDFELLLIDDGSTDNTLEIARRHVGQDSRVRVLHQENAGVCRARNHAVSEAKG